MAVRASFAPSSKAVPLLQNWFFKPALLCCGRAKDGFGKADVVVAIVDAHGEEVLAVLAFEGLGGNFEFVTFAPGIGELANGINVLPCAGIKRVFCLGDG